MARPKSDIEPRVLHAARERFLIDGVDGASLRAIAADAGTSIGMIYYYFPTKDDLFLAVVEEMYSGLMADLERALDPQLPVPERLERMFTRISEVSDNELKIVRLVVREALVSSDRLDRVMERFKRGHIPLVVRTVMDGFADGTFDPRLHPLIVGLATLVLAGPGQLVRKFGASRLPFGGAPEGAELSKKLVEVLLRGVGKKGE